MSLNEVCWSNMQVSSMGLKNPIYSPIHLLIQDCMKIRYKIAIQCSKPLTPLLLQNYWCQIHHEFLDHRLLLCKDCAFLKKIFIFSWNCHKNWLQFEGKGKRHVHSSAYISKNLAFQHQTPRNSRKRIISKIRQRKLKSSLWARKVSLHMYTTCSMRLLTPSARSILWLDLWGCAKRHLVFSTSPR